MGERYWEVDAVRGISLIGMIIFHITSLMVIFHMIFTLDWYYEVCRYIHLGTSIFVIISGVALVLRYGRMAGHSKREYHVAILKRGIEIFLIGIAIAVIASVAIHFFVRDGNYMLFNFLQMMGLSMIICIPFLWLGKWNIIPAAILIWAGFAIKSIHTGPIWLLPLGVLPDGMFYPRDYFPLLPWVGVMLLGVAIGQRRPSFPYSGCGITRQSLLPCWQTYARDLSPAPSHHCCYPLRHYGCLKCAWYAVWLSVRYGPYPYGPDGLKYFRQTVILIHCHLMKHLFRQHRCKLPGSLW